MSASLAAPAAAKGAWLDAWLADLPTASGELAPVQERGRQALRQTAIPSARHEDWRFTDLSLLQTSRKGLARQRIAAGAPHQAQGAGCRGRQASCCWGRRS